MIKSELIIKLSSKMTNLAEKTITESVNSLLHLMSSTLTLGKRIEVRGFGSFSLHHHAQRNAHNPKTGEKVVTEAKYTPHFKPGKELRCRVDNAKDYSSIDD